MTIQYASDLHLEFDANRKFFDAGGLVSSADVLVLAGDVSYLGDTSMEQLPQFDWLADHFREVWIIPGNHEFYRGAELWNTLKDFEYAVRPNVRYINNKSVRIDDAEVFFTTLWSPVPPENIADVQYGMNDTRYICYRGRVLYAGEFRELHGICMDWLANALERSDAGKKVVVTHHCPSRNPVFDNHPGSRISTAFIAPLDDFIEQHDIDAWIFGHTHYNGGNGTVVGGTRLLTNQLGYCQLYENKWFRKDAVLEL